MAAIIVPTRTPLIRAPFLDPDTASYGERPTRKILQIRAATTPPGTGAIQETRDSTASTGFPIPDAERVGLTIDPLTSTTGFTTAQSGVVPTLSAVATNPAGYGGTSLQIALAAMAANGYAWARSPAAPDLSQFSAAAQMKLWIRATSLTNLASILLELRGPSATWVTYTLTPALINTWYEVALTFGTPLAIAPAGAPDWTADGGTYFDIRINAGAGGAYTGNVQVRDFRIGTVTNGATVPAGGLAWESSYDVQVTHYDAGNVAVPSAWATVRPEQPPATTIVSPANAAAVTNPMQPLDFAFTGYAGRTQASYRLQVFEVQGASDLARWDSGYIASAATIANVPAGTLASGKTYAWIPSTKDTDGLEGVGPRYTFTTAFVAPAILAGLTATADADRQAAVLAWTASAEANFAEYRVYRRAGSQEWTRIGTVTDKAAPAFVDYSPPIGIPVGYRVTQWNGDAGGGESDSDTGSEEDLTLSGNWTLNTPDGAIVRELHYVTGDEGSAPLDQALLEVLPRDSGPDDEPPIVITGKLRGQRRTISMIVPPDERDQIALLRSLSLSTAYPYVALRSDDGDVYLGRIGEVQDSRADAGHRTVRFPFVQTIA
jgi:hypothetical protein